MATLQDLITTISTATRQPRARVAQHAYRLRDADILPRSSGSAVAHVDSDHAVALLLVTMLDPDVRDAPRIAHDYAALTCSYDRSSSLAGLLEREIDRSAAGDHALREIILLHEKPGAIVTLEIEGEDTDLHFSADEWPKLTRRTTTHLRGDAFEAIARALD